MGNVRLMMGCALAVAASMRSDPAMSASFGETVIFTLGQVHRQCAPYIVVLSTPITISAPSRIYATATLVAPVFNTGTQVNTMAVRAMGGTTVLGTSIDGPGRIGETPNFRAEGVLHGGLVPFDPEAPPLVLPPGEYRLEVHDLFRFSDQCDFFFGPVVLNYIILSAHFDTVFADGFA